MTVIEKILFILVVVILPCIFIIFLKVIEMAQNLQIIAKELKGLRHQIQETFTPDIFGDGGFSGHPKSTVESLDTLVLEIRGIRREIHDEILDLKYGKPRPRSDS
jgi:hypothetical protein